MFSSVGVSLVDYHRLSFHFNSFSLTHLCIFSTPFMSFSYPFHVLVISFFSLSCHSSCKRNPQIQELYFILAKPSIQEVFRSNLESIGHGDTPRGPEKQISKGSKESCSWFFSSRLSEFHFLTCAFSSVSFMLSISFSCPFMIWSWTLPQIYAQQKFSLFDFLLEKDKTKAKPTPIDLGKGRTP